MYHITVKNPHKKEKGVSRMIVDGKEINSDVLPLSRKKEVDVEVIM